jgi:hypothetical protein
MNPPIDPQILALSLRGTRWELHHPHGLDTNLFNQINQINSNQLNFDTSSLNIGDNSTDVISNLLDVLSSIFS